MSDWDPKEKCIRVPKLQVVLDAVMGLPASVVLDFLAVVVDEQIAVVEMMLGMLDEALI